MDETIECKVSVADTVIVLPPLMVKLPAIPSASSAEVIGDEPSAFKIVALLVMRESTTASCVTRIAMALVVASATVLSMVTST